MPNQPITVYDTSGPYTDPNVTIDVRAGLRLRRAWIEARQDTEELPQVTSQYGRQRAADQSWPTSALRTFAKTPSRQGRTGHQPDALRQEGHHHAGDGIHCDPGESVPAREPKNSWLRPAAMAAGSCSTPAE
ncbi:MAG: hypothetical protein KIT49_01585 [Nitrospira sp.]|nr:hypothetical protein [Nitrospira sp.]